VSEVRRRRLKNLGIQKFSDSEIQDMKPGNRNEQTSYETSIAGTANHAEDVI
jgi:hypothetical protein